MSARVIQFPSGRIEEVLAKKRSKEYKSMILAEDAAGILSEWFTSKNIEIEYSELNLLEKQIAVLISKKL